MLQCTTGRSPVVSLLELLAVGGNDNRSKFIHSVTVIQRPTDKANQGIQVKIAVEPFEVVYHAFSIRVAFSCNVLYEG